MRCADVRASVIASPSTTMALPPDKIDRMRLVFGASNISYLRLILFFNMLQKLLSVIYGYLPFIDREPVRRGERWTSGHT